jgi:hypothetical protein
VPLLTNLMDHDGSDGLQGDDEYLGPEVEVDEEDSTNKEDKTKA